MEERRLLAGAGAPDDTGDADPRLEAALAAYDADQSREPDVLAALGEARLLVPVVAVLGEAETGPDGLARDKSSEMAAVLLRRPDGRTAQLAFTGLEALRRWDPEARPVPVPARVAAQAALQDGASALVVDVAGPVSYALDGSDLGALAAGWVLGRVGGRSAWIGEAPESSDTIER